MLFSTAVCLTLACTGALVDAAPNRREIEARVLLQTLTMDDLNVGDSPDVSNLYDSTLSGCFGIHPCSDTSMASVQKDPASDSDSNVMRVKYKSGKYAGDSGLQFYTTQLQEEFSSQEINGEGTLEYSVYFPKGFDFKLGGKLPGLFGGEDRECSGNREADGTNCFTARLMWRENGFGETYFYLPFTKQDSSFCARCTYPTMTDQCTNEAHCSWERGSFEFKSGSWTTIKQYIRMNTPGKTDGLYRLTVNGKEISYSNQVYYRETYGLKIGGMYFSTFFGGGSSQYAPDDDQYAYFKGIKLSSGEA
eukprot:CFRG4538T1